MEKPTGEISAQDIDISNEFDKMSYCYGERGEKHILLTINDRKTKVTLGQIPIFLTFVREPKKDFTWEEIRATSGETITEPALKGKVYQLKRTIEKIRPMKKSDTGYLSGGTKIRFEPLKLAQVKPSSGGR